MGDSICTTIHKHVKQLGSISGLRFSHLGVDQFWGIPYATVPGRFRESKVVESWDNGVHDGSKLGATVAQMKRTRYSIPQYEREWLKGGGEDENGLNLNVSVPLGTGPDPRPLLPVLLFIHGGANNYGAGNACMYDGLQLCAKSAAMGQPTIVVTFNYRLGAAGFMASHDLVRYRAQFGESGAGNYGVSDQTNLLRWVNKYIGDFGGDNTRITVFGQSAGSQAAHLAVLNQTESKQKLFSRAILQSGLTPLCGILSVEEYDSIYFKLLEKLGIDTTMSWEKRVDALLKVDTARLVAANDGISDIECVTMAYTQNEGQQQLPTWNEMGRDVSGAVDAIMVGDCQNEAVIWCDGYNDLTALDVVNYIRHKTPAANTIMELYGITDDMEPEKLSRQLEQLTTDGLFRVPNYVMYQANGQSLVYHFYQPSSYDNQYCGLAHHSLDNVYVWGCLDHTLDREQKELSRYMGKSWIEFANGGSPWRRYNEYSTAGGGKAGGTGNVMTFGPQGKYQERQQNDTQERVGIWKDIVDGNMVQELAKVSEGLCWRRR